MIIYDLRLDEMIKPTKKPSRLGVVVKIANEVSKNNRTSLLHINVTLDLCISYPTIGHYKEADIGDQ